LDALRRADEIDALTAAARKGIAAFVEVISTLSAQQDALPDALIKDLIERAGYARALGNSAEGAERLRNVEELINAAAQYGASAETPTLTGFLEEVALVSDQDGLDDKSPTVSLMTLHAAKGLEFPAVFIVGVEQGLLPHERSQNTPAGMEEERRLLYVGMTRAKRDLTLSYALRRRRFGVFVPAYPSPFFNEISPERFGRHQAAPSAAHAPAHADERTTSTLAEGDTVRSAKFGVGVVQSVSGSGEKLKVVVDFDAAGTKTLMVAYAKLEKLIVES